MLLFGLLKRNLFDRILIAQAMNNDLILVSKDQAFNSYSLEKIWE